MKNQRKDTIIKYMNMNTIDEEDEMYTVSGSNVSCTLCMKSYQRYKRSLTTNNISDIFPSPNNVVLAPYDQIEMTFADYKLVEIESNTDKANELLKHKDMKYVSLVPWAKHLLKKCDVEKYYLCPWDIECISFEKYKYHCPYDGTYWSAVRYPENTILDVAKMDFEMDSCPFMLS